MPEPWPELRGKPDVMFDSPATGPVFARGNVVVINSTEARRAVFWFRHSLDRLGVTCGPYTPLGQMCQRVLRYANGLDGYRPLPVELRLEGRRILDRLWRLGIAAEVMPHIPGYRDKLRHLRKHPDPANTLDSQAQDHLFEVEVAASLHLAGLPAELDERPDVRCGPMPKHSELGQLGIACKRPRTLESLDRALDEADDQIRKCGLNGIVFANVDNIVNPPDPTTGRPRAWYTEAREAFHLSANAQLAQIAERSRYRARKDGPVLGVVWWSHVGAVLAAGPDAGNTLNQRCMRVEPTRPISRTRPVLAEVVGAVFSTQLNAPAYRGLSPLTSTFRRAHRTDRQERVKRSVAEIGASRWHGLDEQFHLEALITSNDY